MAARVRRKGRVPCASHNLFFILSLLFFLFVYAEAHARAACRSVPGTPCRCHAMAPRGMRRTSPPRAACYATTYAGMVEVAAQQQRVYA